MPHVDIEGEAEPHSAIQEPETRVEFIARQKIIPEKVFEFTCENEALISPYLDNYFEKIKEEMLRIQKQNEESGDTKAKAELPATIVPNPA